WMSWSRRASCDACRSTVFVSFLPTDRVSLCGSTSRRLTNYSHFGRLLLRLSGPSRQPPWLHQRNIYLAAWTRQKAGGVVWEKRRGPPAHGKGREETQGGGPGIKADRHLFRPDYFQSVCTSTPHG